MKTEKDLVTVFILSILLLITLVFVVVIQRDDQMTMIHWIEIIWIEILTQAIYNKLTEK